jgi:Holliday junction resolvase RusA-like endonuclease
MDRFSMQNLCEELRPGMWAVQIARWKPISLNVLMAMHWRTRNRHKQGDYALIKAMCAGVKKAVVTRKPSHGSKKGAIIDGESGPVRKVDIVITLGKGHKRMDKDNVWKVALDGLKAAGVIVDDSEKWLVRGEVEYHRSGSDDFGTIIIITDV